MRHAGSGSKAIFQKAMMEDGDEVTLGSPFAIFNLSSSNMRSCLNSNNVATRGRIGYIDVKESQATPPYCPFIPNVPAGTCPNTFGATPSALTNAYAVAVDGYRAVDSSPAATSRALSQKAMWCGNGYFTTDLRTYRRAIGSYPANVELLTNAYIGIARDPDVSGRIATSWAFGGEEDMLFARTDDGGVHDHTFDKAGAGSNAVCNGL
jgi:hypothetical protein